MPNDAGRHLVAFALGMRCFTCPGASENLVRHLPAAVSACKRQNVFKLLPGRLLWALQKAVSASDMGLLCEGEGLEGNAYSTSPLQEAPIAPGFPWGPKAQWLHMRLVAVSNLPFQHCLWVSLIVFKEGFSTISFAQQRHTCTYVCLHLLHLQV